MVFHGVVGMKSTNTVSTFNELIVIHNRPLTDNVFVIEIDRESYHYIVIGE